MLTKYPTYKDSKLKWIGEIPSHWDNVSTKLVSKIVNGSTPKNNVEYWEGEVVWITPSDIGPIKEQVFISDSKRKITIEGLNSCGCSMCPKNSLILTNRGPIGNVVISTVEFTTNQGCKVMIPKENMNVKYLYYFFKISNEELNMLGQGTTFLELSTNSLSMFKVNLPPLSEQQQIVSFLDTKTSHIDSLIEKTQRKIELLKEKRTSLINEVVTKGLNPNVELKDSGVEWIGEIPIHWIVSKFKYDSSTPVQYGINISGDKYVEEGIRFIRITDISESGELNPNNGKYLVSEDVPNEFLLRKFDVLFCRSGHTVGKTYLHTSDGHFTSGGYLVRFNFRNYTESKYIFYISKTDFYLDWIKLNTVVSTIENVNGDKYQNFIYPKPPLSEQQQIVEYLDEQTQKIDKTISIEEKRIELLKEYRQSLISEVVTGKRKVVE